MVVTDLTAGTAIGTVTSVAATTATLVANAANAVTTADVLSFAMPNDRIKNRIDSAAQVYIAAWSGS
jgi:hypothetical protein